MKWYSKYLPVYEKPFAEVPADVVAEVRTKLAERQSDKPLVTVSIIAYNEEKRLTACLWSLAEQQCRYPMEIIGTDNMSKDRTAEVFEALELPWKRETTPGCGHARLCGLGRARGKYHINIDADTMYPPRYVETMVEALERKGVVAVSSLWSYIPDAAHSALGLWFYELARDMHLWLQSFKRPELSVRGLVFAYNTSLARKVGIRTDIIRGEDGSLALGLKPYGRIAFVRKRRARAVTGYGTVSKDGSLMDSFRVRAVKALKSLGGVFTSKSEYKDEDDNLLYPGANKNSRPRKAGSFQSETLGVSVTVRLRPFAVVIVLVIPFRWPEGRSLRDVRHDIVTLRAQLGNQFFGCFALGRRRIENLGAILVADIRSLPVDLRRIVNLEKEPRQPLIGDLRRVERHPHRLGMSRAVAANLLVSGIFGVTADITRFDIEHAGLLREQVLHAPETTSGEDRRLGLLLFGGLERQRHGIDAVARILGRKPLACKNMPQMAAAPGAGNLRPPSVGIHAPLHGPGNFVVETRPAASRVELVRRTVQRRAALPAEIGSGLVVLVITSREGGFGPLVHDHMLLFRCQRFHVLSIYGPARSEANYP